MAKIQNRLQEYADATDLNARAGYVLDEAYQVSLKSPEPSVIYNASLDSALADDGVICIHDADTVKWIQANAKATGNFLATYTGTIESGAEDVVVGVVATGVLLANIYQFQRINATSTAGVELVEEPIVTADGLVSVKIRNTTNGDLVNPFVDFNWAELGNA